MTTWMLWGWVLVTQGVLMGVANFGSAVVHETDVKRSWVGALLWAALYLPFYYLLWQVRP